MDLQYNNNTTCMHLIDSMVLQHGLLVIKYRVSMVGGHMKSGTTHWNVLYETKGRTKLMISTAGVALFAISLRTTEVQKSAIYACSWTRFSVTQCAVH